MNKPNRLIKNKKDYLMYIKLIKLKNGTKIIKIMKMNIPTKMLTYEK